MSIAEPSAAACCQAASTRGNVKGTDTLRRCKHATACALTHTQKRAAQQTRSDGSPGGSCGCRRGDGHRDRAGVPPACPFKEATLELRDSRILELRSMMHRGAEYAEAAVLRAGYFGGRAGSRSPAGRSLAACWSCTAYNSSTTPCAAAATTRGPSRRGATWRRSASPPSRCWSSASPS